MKLKLRNLGCSALALAVAWTIVELVLRSIYMADSSGTNNSVVISSGYNALSAKGNQNSRLKCYAFTHNAKWFNSLANIAIHEYSGILT